jgi:hypothetical protein
MIISHFKYTFQCAQLSLPLRNSKEGDGCVKLLRVRLYIETNIIPDIPMTRAMTKVSPGRIVLPKHTHTHTHSYILKYIYYIHIYIFHI